MIVAASSIVLVVAPIRGAAANDEYRVSVDKKVTVELGKPGAVSFTIAAKSGHRISRDGPVVIRVGVKPTVGLVLSKTRYGRRDAADTRAADPRFDLRFQTRAVGDYVLTIEATFWVCARRTCRPAKERASTTIHVVAPPPPPDAGVSANP